VADIVVEFGIEFWIILEFVKGFGQFIQNRLQSLGYELAAVLSEKTSGVGQFFVHVRSPFAGGSALGIKKPRPEESTPRFLKILLNKGLAAAHVYGPPPPIAGF
jgi:hypothetical protein